MKSVFENIVPRGFYLNSAKSFFFFKTVDVVPINFVEI